ncbi:MAG: hypothetical protein AAFY41_01020 [Bacteroidota bacterium]
MKILFVLFTLFFSASVFGQDALTTGNRILGGGVSFSQQNIEDDEPFFNPNFNEERTVDIFSFSFSPYYGRIYKDLSMVGLRMRVSRFNREVNFEFDGGESSTVDMSNSFALGGFLRRYFPYSDRFGVFLEGGIDGTISNTKSTSERFDIVGVREETLVSKQESETRSIGASIDTEVGIYFFVLNELSIETRLARFFLSYSDREIENRDLFNNTVNEGDGSSTSVDFNLINNFSFDQIFTINYYF